MPPADRLDCVNLHKFLASACMKVVLINAALIWIKRALWYGARSTDAVVCKTKPSATNRHTSDKGQNRTLSPQQVASQQENCAEMRREARLLLEPRLVKVLSHARLPRR